MPTLTPVYQGNDEIITYDNVITLKEKEINGICTLQITPRQLISALRSGIQVRIIAPGHNGGIIPTPDGPDSYVYAGLTEITECSYVVEEECFFIIVTNPHSIYNTFMSPSLDTFFMLYPDESPVPGPGPYVPAPNDPTI